MGIERKAKTRKVVHNTPPFAQHAHISRDHNNMNYRHIYHAGNFADVFKHVLLIALIQSLREKNTPFLYLDTHAGVGEYDFQETNAQKTQEYRNGVDKLASPLYTKKIASSRLLQDYLNIINAWNEKRDSKNIRPSDVKTLKPMGIRYYPGSPMLAKTLLRPFDRMILTELHPEDKSQLKQHFARDKQVGVHHLDGYQALKAFLPPKENRGLILIDPPFEKTDEYQQIVQHLVQARMRWPTGIYAIWYPIKDAKAVKTFYKDLAKSGIREILCCEMQVSNIEEGAGLQACGMIIVSPPWQWQKKIGPVLAHLSHILSRPGEGRYLMKWLVQE
jgi:23S rRNA (adenine2030-N6)-methyltransferase